MAITAERLRVEIDADISGAERGMDAVEDRGRRIPGWAGAAAAGVATLATGLGVVGGFAINAASDLNETISKTGQVFGDSAGQVTGYAQQMADDFGLPRTAILDAASSFGLLGNAAGLAESDTAGMSTALAGLAADASSFYNVPLDEALASIQSGLVGEAEPMRRFGVLLNEAAVEAKALEMGIYDGNGAMTEAQKVQARSALIMEGMATASGDLARTQGSVSNQMREVQGRVQNLAADFGTLLLPAAERVLGWANDMLGALPPVGDMVTGLGDRFAPVAALWDTVTTGMRASLDALVNGFQNSGENLGGSFDGPMGTILNTFQTLGQAAGEFLAPIIPAFQSLWEAVAPLVPQLLQVVTNLNPLSVLFHALMPVLPQIAGLIGELVATLAGALGPVLQAIVPVLAQVAQVLVGALTQAFVGLMPAITTLLPVITELVTIVGGVLGTVVTALAPIITMLADVFTTSLLPALMTLVPPIMDVVQALLPIVAVVGDLIGALLPPLVALFMALLEPVLALIGPLVSALAPILTTVAGIIRDLVVPHVTRMAQFLGVLVNAVAPVIAVLAGGLVTALSTLIRWVVQAAAAILTFVGDAIAAVGRFASNVATKVGEVFDWFRRIPETVKGALSGAGSWLTDSGRKIIQGLIDGIKAMAGRVKDAIGGVLQKARDLLPFSPAKEGPFSGKGWTLYSGRSIPQALAEGIADETAAVRRAALDMARAAQVDLQAPTLGSGAARVAPTALSGGSLAPRGSVVVNMTAYNPVAETSSQATNRALQRVANLGLV